MTGVTGGDLASVHRRAIVAADWLVQGARRRKPE